MNTLFSISAMEIDRPENSKDPTARPSINLAQSASAIGHRKHAAVIREAAVRAQQAL